MFSKRIIPCLDIFDGKVVKGIKFKGIRIAGDPVELARAYNDQGADELVFLDITASSDKRNILIDLVTRVADELFIPFTVGGGISSLEIIHDLLRSGADKVSINSAAVKNPNLIRLASKKYGSQCIVLAVDVKAIIPMDLEHDNYAYVSKEFHIDKNSLWQVYINGGRIPTGIDALKWVRYMNEFGAGEILLTSMDADGTKEGYDLSLLSAVKQVVSCPVIASGGAGSFSHIVDALQISDAALIASLLHYGEYTVDSIKAVCQKEGIVVRPNIV